MAKVKKKKKKPDLTKESANNYSEQLLVGLQNFTATFENNLTESHDKVKDSFTTQTSNATHSLGIYPNEMKTYTDIIVCV